TRKLAKPDSVSRGWREIFKMTIRQNRVDQAARVISRSVATTWAPRYGFGRKTLPAGKSSAPTLTRPDVATILIGGHLSRDESGELQTVHRARHLDISENDVNRRASLKDCHRLVGIARLDNFKLGIFERLGRIHSQQEFVFDNQDYRTFSRHFTLHCCQAGS